MDAMPANIVPGRKAGKDHARSQCPLRGEDLQCQSTDAGQSPQAVARKTIRTPNPFREASSGLRRAEEPTLGTGYIVPVRKIGLIEAGYRDLVRKSRSRASSSRDDCLFLLHVILYCHKRESREYRMRVEGVASRHP